LIEISPLELKDCFSVAEAHIQNLRTPFRGNAGIHILKIRYEVIAKQIGGTGFVALDDGKFAGFVCGIWDPDAISRSIRKQWSRLILNGLKHIIQSPKTTLGLILRIIGPRTINPVKIVGYELRPIVVLPGHRGRGIADQLTMHVVEDAKKRGYQGMFLLTEIDNLTAARFYTKFGFNFEREINMAGYVYKLFRYHFPTNGA
jgi:ribosomal protein S18 acetylase RimI-like enzyme